MKDRPPIEHFCVCESELCQFLVSAQLSIFVECFALIREVRVCCRVKYVKLSGMFDMWNKHHLSRRLKVIALVGSTEAARTAYGDYVKAISGSLGRFSLIFFACLYYTSSCVSLLMLDCTMLCPHHEVQTVHGPLRAVSNWCDFESLVWHLSIWSKLDHVARALNTEMLQIMLTLSSRSCAQPEQSLCLGN